MKSASTIIDECRELLNSEDEEMKKLVDKGYFKRQLFVNKQYEKYGIKQVEGIDVIYSNEFGVNLCYLYL
jgi:hypothetical protein